MWCICLKLFQVNQQAVVTEMTASSQAEECVAGVVVSTTAHSNEVRYGKDLEVILSVKE